MGAIQVLRPDTRGQAVIAVVGVVNDFGFVLERRDRNYWSKNFLTIGATGNGQISDHGWVKEITLAATIVRRLRRFAAEGNPAALLLREIDIKLHLVELRF